MPTEFWYPISGAGHDLPHDTATLGAGANKNAATRPGGGRSGPMTHDDGTSYVTNGTNGPTPASQCYNIDWPGPMVQYTGTLTAGCRYASVQSGGVWDGATGHYRFVNAALTAGTDFVAATDSAAYTTSGPIDVSNAGTYRPGGGSWSAADFIDDKTIFVDQYMSGLVNDTHVTTSIWGEISYTPPSGGFAFLLQLAGAAALPFVGRMDFGQFMRYLSWRRAYHPRHTILTSDEVRRAWDEIRAYRHPKFFLPGVV